MFGERLNTTRKNKGYTALQMADWLSVSLSTYRKYESGRRTPYIDTLTAIANILDASTDYLLGRDDFLKSHGVSFGE